MFFWRAWLLLVLAFAWLPAALADQSQRLVLVQGGKPKSVIVVAPAASKAAQAAAVELQTYVAQISGAMLPIRSEKNLPAGSHRQTLILVGTGELARAAGLATVKPQPEGFVIRTVGNLLLVSGTNDEAAGDNGTAFAVSALLEDQLGVRWLWPGPLGEVVPRSASITVGSLDRVEAPVLRQRKIRDTLRNDNPRKYGRGRRLMKMDPLVVHRMMVESDQWRDRQRLGGSLDLKYQHAFRHWWPEFHKQHPDYFAEQLNGSRDWPLVLGDYDRAKLCISNPDVLEQFMADAVVYLNQHPKLASVSASPNDNAYGGHCMCRQCKAWDVQQAQRVPLVSVNGAGLRVKFQYPALSDRYIHFYNLAAERLEKVMPGKYIAGYAYGAWRFPPVRERVRDNVVIGFVGFNRLSDNQWNADRENWRQWAKITRHLFLRPNLLNEGHGYPRVYVHRLARMLRDCSDTGLMGVDFDSLTHHWAGQGLNYYVLAKLLWNPQADVDAIVDDYCRKGFGAAAPAIKAYFQALERHTLDVSAKVDIEKRRDYVMTALPYNKSEVFAALQKHLDEARRLAAADKLVQQRIQFLAKGLEYAQLQSKALMAIQAAGSDESTPEAARAVAARQGFYEENKHSFAIGVAELVGFEAQSRDLRGPQD